MDISNLPPPKSNHKWFGNDQSNEVLVFVHGILSDSRSCWLAQDGASGSVTFWPELIASDARFRKIGLYLGGYHTGVDAGDFPIQQCAAELFAYLKTEDQAGRPSVLSKQKITFVCHSMGGIVVRYMLCENADRFKDIDVGIVLIASPSYGSQFQRSLDYIVRLYNHEQGKQLKWGSEMLKELDDRFKNLIARRKFKSFHGVEFYENRFRLNYKWFPWFSRTKIVRKEEAARYFGFAKMVGGSDHSSICKPTSANDAVHQYLLEFLDDNDLLPLRPNAYSVSPILSMGYETSESASCSNTAEAAENIASGNTFSNDRPTSPHARDISTVLSDFHGSDPVKGGQALTELLEFGQDGQDAFFSTPLSIRSMQARRRMLAYVSARAATVTPVLLQRLSMDHQFGDAYVAAQLLSGVPSSNQIRSEIIEQLRENFSEDLAYRRDGDRGATMARLLALGHADASAGDIALYVDHDEYAWEKLAVIAFRSACVTFARGERGNGAIVSRLVVQTGPLRCRPRYPHIASKEIPSEAIDQSDVRGAFYFGPFAIWRSGAAVDDILMNWSDEDKHWRARYLGAGIVASASFKRTVEPVNEWLGRESDPDVRGQLFRALGSAGSPAGATALVARYLQHQGGEGQDEFSTSAWRCPDGETIRKQLELLARQDIAHYPASIVSLARMGYGYADIESCLGAKNFFVRANAALAIGFLRDESFRSRLRAQLHEAAAPIERICVTAALLMLGAATESTLHSELVAGTIHSDLQFRIDPYFLLTYIQEAIWEAFASLNAKSTPIMDAWRAEFHPLS